MPADAWNSDLSQVWIVGNPESEIVMGNYGECVGRRSAYVYRSVISPSSVSALLPPLLSLRLDGVEQQGMVLTLTVSSTEHERACPSCGQLSRTVHSRYQRTLTDLPVQGLRLCFRMRVRRFYCRARDCVRQIFCERLENFAHRHARQTQRLALCLKLIAQALGGNAGSRLAERLSLPVSATWLLRHLRQFAPPLTARPRVIGIDDWAYKRGHKYATIVVDWSSTGS